MDFEPWVKMKLYKNELINYARGFAVVEKIKRVSLK